MAQIEPFPELLTLNNLLAKSVSSFSNRPALSFWDGEATSYSELGSKAAEISMKLREIGITQGDRVAILAENSPNWAIAYFSVTTIGAVVVPILPDFAPDAIIHILRHCGAKAIFVSGKLKVKLENAKLDFFFYVISLDSFTVDADNGFIKGVFSLGLRELGKLRDAAMKMAGREFKEVREDETAAIIYTSGTTGHSKGVVLSHKNIVSTAISGYKTQPLTTDDRLLSILPLSHTYESTLGLILPIMSGSQVFYFDKPPSPTTLLQAMQKIRPTMILSVPLVIEKIYKNKILPNFRKNALTRFLYSIPALRRKFNRIAGRKLMESFGGCIHFFGIGGAPLAPEVERFLREADFPYAIGYGMTEASPCISGAGPKHTLYQAAGTAMYGVTLKIIDPDPKTGEGEIVLKGPNVMKGYYKDPEKTREAFTEDGWLRTGDLGYIASNDYLYVKGRLKNLILGPSGENIYPEEIEGLLNEHPYVKECLVLERNKKIVALVHPDYQKIDDDFGDKEKNEKQMMEIIREMLGTLRTETNSRLSGFSRIHEIIERTEPFDKTPTQKIKRYLYLS